MNSTLRIFGEVAGLGGFAIGVFLVLFRRINLPIATRRHLTLFMWLVWSVAIIGLICYTLSILFVRIAPTESEIARIKIETLAKEILGQSPVIGKKRVDQIVSYVKGLDTIDARYVALKELLAVLFAHDGGNPIDQNTRLLRNHVVQGINELSNIELSSLFRNGELEDLDLYGMDFHNANLRNVSFKGCFLVETNFSGAILDGSNFTGAFIRNVNFENASLQNVDFSESDWFNSRNLTIQQLETSKIKTLEYCPSDEAALREYLSSHYYYPFETWTALVQTQLLESWHLYLSSGGCSEFVAKQKQQLANIK